jgi:membrane protease YdiL (CAAX protease family)
MMQSSSPLNLPHPISRWDILWYLLAGYGGYITLMTLMLAALAISKDAWSLLQAILQVIFLVGTTWLLGEHRGRFTWAELGLFPLRWQRRWWVWIMGLGLAGAFFNLLTERIHNSLRQGSLEGFSLSNNLPWGSIAITWLATGLMIPLAEEIFFRGAVYTWCEKMYGGWAALIGSTALFAITRATFFSSKSLLYVIQSLILGAITAYAMQRTRSLWVPIGIHVLTYSLALGIILLIGLF